MNFRPPQGARGATLRPLGLYAAAIGLAFVSPWISYAIYVAVAVMWFIPDRRFTRS